MSVTLTVSAFKIRTALTLVQTEIGTKRSCFSNQNGYLCILDVVPGGSLFMHGDGKADGRGVVYFRRSWYLYPPHRSLAKIASEATCPGLLCTSTSLKLIAHEFLVIIRFGVIYFYRNSIRLDGIYYG
jgi:hypothetical protein